MPSHWLLATANAIGYRTTASFVSCFDYYSVARERRVIERRHAISPFLLMPLHIYAFDYAITRHYATLIDADDYAAMFAMLSLRHAADAAADTLLPPR